MKVLLDHLEFGLYVSTNNPAFEPSYTVCIDIVRPKMKFERIEMTEHDPANMDWLPHDAALPQSDRALASPFDVSSFYPAQRLYIACRPG